MSILKINFSIFLYLISLFAEAMNEEGLCIAGLNFPGYSIYNEKESALKDNITPYEIILWLLSKCKSVNEAKILIQNMNIIAIPFSENLPLAPLHWIIFIISRNRFKTTWTRCWRTRASRR